MPDHFFMPAPQCVPITFWPYVKEAMVCGSVTLSQLTLTCARCYTLIDTRWRNNNGAIISCGHFYHKVCLMEILMQTGSACAACGIPNTYIGCECFVPCRDLPKNRAEAQAIPPTRPEGGIVSSKCRHHQSLDAMEALVQSAWVALCLLDRNARSQTSPNLIAATDGHLTTVCSASRGCLGHGTFEDLNVQELLLMQPECQRQAERLTYGWRFGWGDRAPLDWRPCFRIGRIPFENRTDTCQNCMKKDCKNVRNVGDED